MSTLRRLTLLAVSAAVATLPFDSMAQRPRPPNLKMGQGIDMRDGPLLNVSRIDVGSISLGGASYVTAWPTNGFLKAADLAPYSTTAADAASDLVSVTDAAGYTPAANFLYTTNGSVAVITGYVGSAVNVRIPPYLSRYPVVSIGGAGTCLSVPVKSVILPPTLRNIADAAFISRAFSGGGMASIVIPASVTNIGSGQFGSTTTTLFEGPAPTVGSPLNTGGPATAYYLAGYRYPATLGGTATALYGPAQAADRLYTDGTNLFFITLAGVTNTVTITPP